MADNVNHPAHYTQSGEDTSFDYDFSDDIAECCECKYYNVEFEDDGTTWGEPCKSCRNGMLPNSPEYETAKLKWEPKENK